MWKFPWLTGQNGGGAFVLLYILFLLILGVPVLTMELAIGRKSRMSSASGFKALEKQGSKWHVLGYAGLIGSYLLMMFYTSVAGWMMSYTVKFVSGVFQKGMSSESIGGVFSSMLTSPFDSIFFMVLAVVIGIVACGFGLKKGVEKITKVMMVGLLGLIVVLVVHSLTLPGAKEGLKFYLVPSFKVMKENGIFNVISAAMCQAFFTLSLGIGCMQIFGTYMSDEKTLLSESISISLLDTFVAISAGLIIFPACYSYGISPDAGPSLIFKTLPMVFTEMAGGRVWGSLFFVFMSFAALSTVIAVFENIIASFMDIFSWSRKKSTIVNFFGLLLLSLPCALENNLLAGIKILPGKGVLDSWDYIVSSLLLPIGSLCLCLFCIYSFGWGYEKYLEEANKGKGLKIPNNKVIKYFFGLIIPILVAIIIVIGL